MVLLCYDGSPTAKRAVSIAHEILGDTRATVLHVWQPPSEFLSPDWFGAPSAPPIAQLEALALENAERVAAEGGTLAQRLGFAVETRAEVRSGGVWRTILEVADAVDAELIVVGARGLSSVESVLIGSVSNAVVHHSHRSVLVVPPEGGP